MPTNRPAPPRSRRLLRALGFWTAVALPFGYLPLPVLVPAEPWLVPVLLVAVLANLIALVVGHDHRRPEPPAGKRGKPAD